MTKIKHCLRCDFTWYMDDSPMSAEEGLVYEVQYFYCDECKQYREEHKNDGMNNNSTSWGMPGDEDF